MERLDRKADFFFDEYVKAECKRFIWMVVAFSEAIIIAAGVFMLWVR